MAQNTSDPEISYTKVDRHALQALLEACLAATELAQVRELVAAYRLATVGAAAMLRPEFAPQDPDTVLLQRDVFIRELDQVLEARTLGRAAYYLRRLEKSTGEARTCEVNDVNLNRWKEYDEILTDSLWVMDRRDTSGAHRGWYWGNFVPQIPHQMMLRYTKARDWVLDPFAGSGTTLIECRRLGRHGIGVELNPEVAARAAKSLASEPNPHAITTDIVVGDSAAIDYTSLLRAYEIEYVQLLILHPPYHDIIQFSRHDADLSNAASVDAFVDQFAAVVARARAALAPRRYLAVIIGDKYQDGEWIPLGFRAMQAVMAQGCTLKSIVVKNLDRTRAKREQQALWRYRALAGGFYVFKHEYIFVFQTP
ncbi:MAG: site-specific DNA-methyltransferase [Anaerolineae bacterium]|nr:site-specific DNA-methyltransferase [Anaerolineae bacterium]